MPLWLDLLRTPMAAPETRSLKRLRRGWQLLCLLTAVTIGCYGPLHGWLGQRAALLAFGLLVVLAVQSWLYLSNKHVADSSFLFPPADHSSCFQVGNTEPAAQLAKEQL